MRAAASFQTFTRSPPHVYAYITHCAPMLPVAVEWAEIKNWNYELLARMQRILQVTVHVPVGTLFNSKKRVRTGEGFLRAIPTGTSLADGPQSRASFLGPSEIERLQSAHNKEAPIIKNVVCSGSAEDAGRRPRKDGEGRVCPARSSAHSFAQNWYRSCGLGHGRLALYVPTPHRCVRASRLHR